MKPKPTPPDALPPNGAGPRFTPGLSIAHRIAAALLGGYACTWGFAAFGMAALAVAGMDFHEAEHAIMLVAFIIYLLALLWAFAGRSLARIWMVLGGGGAVMALAAWLLQRSLLG